VTALFATVVAAGMLVVVVVKVYSTFNYNADSLYLPALYRDIASGTPLGHWTLPAVPGFIPDMPLMFLMLQATGQNVGLSFVSYGTGYMILLAATTLYLVSGLVKLRWTHPMVVLACLFLWGCVFLVGETVQDLIAMVLMPSFHSGVIPVGLFVLGCTVRLFQAPRPKALAVAWVLLAAGGIASDPFFLVQFLVPILLCLYLCRRSTRFPDGVPFWKSSLLAASSVVLALAGLAVVRRRFRLGADTWGPLKIQLTDLSSLLSEANRMVFGPIWEANRGIYVLTAVGFLLAVLLVLRQCWLLRPAARAVATPASKNGRLRLLFCMLFFLVSGATTLAFPILANILASIRLCRYIEPAFLLPAIVLAVFLSLLAGCGSKVTRLGAVALACLALVIPVTVLGLDLWPNRQLPPRLQTVEDLDELHRQTGLADGLGDYWLAKPTLLLSATGVHLGQMVPWEPHRGITNMLWFLRPGQTGTPRLRKYEFIVPFQDCPPDRIIAKFGPPESVFRGQGLVAMIYNRRTDVAFRNFLYIPVLRAMGIAPPSTVKSPTGLQEYKADGLPYNHPGCSLIPVNGSLDVVFDPPAEGDVLEVSADGNDEYEADVRYADGRSETLKLAVSSEAGLQRRFLRLSSLTGTPRVKGVTIRPVAGDGVHSVGHVYVYNDNW